MRQFYVSDEDAKILREMVHDYRHRNRGFQGTSGQYPLEGMDGSIEGDTFTPEVYLVEIPAAGIPATVLSGGKYTVGKATCDIYKLWPVSDDPAIVETKVVWADVITGVVHNISLTPIYRLGGNKYALAIKDKYGHWFAQPPGCVLTELCLAEDHPGRGVVFDAYRGTWNAGSDRWSYQNEETGTGTDVDCEGEATVKAIDWREGTPEPTAGARGYFIPWPSTTHGVIYDCVSLDCDTPGTCCADEV